LESGHLEDLRGDGYDLDVSGCEMDGTTSKSFSVAGFVTMLAHQVLLSNLVFSLSQGT
jgi:hypothetical protein